MCSVRLLPMNPSHPSISTFCDIAPSFRVPPRSEYSKLSAHGGRTPRARVPRAKVQEFNGPGLRRYGQRLAAQHESRRTASLGRPRPPDKKAPRLGLREGTGEGARYGPNEIHDLVWAARPV